MKPGEEHILFDLQERGIHLIPSARSQLASRSKTFQARIFHDFMLPDSLPVYDQHDLLSATTLYSKNQHSDVILKREGKNGGLGIHRFSSIEDLYNQVGGGGYPFPFVIQPFLAGSIDLRVIILGDYHEAYQRSNRYNFRQNMHCGGTAAPFPLNDQILDFCSTVMKRGQFPYAHLDLMVTDSNEMYLQEINLRGGLRGAKISSGEYKEKLEAIHSDLLHGHTRKNSQAG